MERTVRTPDGRTLAVQTNGDADGRPVLVLMGTPNSRHLYAPVVADAENRGLLLISHDRPGYGGSTSQPGRTIADCASDVRAICADLGIDRIGVWGISGGGPHTLACAALLPDLVVAAASLASPAPYDADGLDYFADMGQDNVDDTKLSLADPIGYRAKADVDREELLKADLASLYPSLLSPTDAAVLTGELAAYLEFSAREGLAHTAQGWHDDSIAMVKPWGFDVADIAVPVLLMHGRHDNFVPFGHGEWLASRIPGVDARLSDVDGHLTLLENRIGEVHSWLRERV